ncbi:MAG: diguanylate cyclase (GGDEF)-like protein/PAS domain S-box-containing protein [Alteromonadaceae bacterium]
MINLTQQVNSLQESLEVFFSATGVGMWEWDIQTEVLTVNESWSKTIGYSAVDLQSITISNWLAKLHPQDLIKAKNMLTKHYAGELDFFEIEIRLKHKSGHYIWVLVLGKLVGSDEEGNPQRIIGSHREITKRKDKDVQLLINSQLLEDAQQLGRFGGWQLDLQTKRLFWTNEIYLILETSPEEFNPTVDTVFKCYLPDSQNILSEALHQSIHHGVCYDLELESYTTKGNKIDVRTTCTVTLEEGVPVTLSGIFQDISDQKTNQRKLEKSNLDLADANSALTLSANYDALTGLPNRKLLGNLIDQALSKSLQTNKYVAIVCIEVDGFKKVNDTYGENLRNRLVKKVVSQFTRILREGDTLSRIGGDEFVVIINNLSKPSASDAIVSRLLKSVSGTLLVKKKSLKITTSAGLTCYPLDNVSRDELIKHADHAMYIAKQKGINNRHVFNIEKDVAEKHHNEELRRIAQALKDDEFILYYQPKVDLRTNEVVGFEGLIRWDHPDNGLLAPAMFLPVVENDILGIEMGRWVINKALLQLQYALSIGYDIPISVNISSLHLQHDEFVSDLKEILSRYPNFKAGSLEFEILETSALKDIDIVSTVIRECNKLGVLSSIDDFGTGYSSLTYLRRLPADFLKIDQSFVKGVLTSSDDKAIVQGIIELAKIFNLKVVAEGVETPEHGEILLSMGSYIAQGYGIAKPMPAKDILTWLVNWKNNPCLVDRSI